MTTDYPLDDAELALLEVACLDEDIPAEFREVVARLVREVRALHDAADEREDDEAAVVRGLERELRSAEEDLETAESERDEAVAEARQAEDDLEEARGEARRAVEDLESARDRNETLVRELAAMSDRILKARESLVP